MSDDSSQQNSPSSAGRPSPASATVLPSALDPSTIDAAETAKRLKLNAALQSVRPTPLVPGAASVQPLESTLPSSHPSMEPGPSTDRATGPMLPGGGTSGSHLHPSSAGYPLETDDETQASSADSPEVAFTWQESTLRVALDTVETIGDLKTVIYSVTSVPPERQKLLGLVPGKIPADNVLLSTIQFKLKRGVHFKLLGSSESVDKLESDGALSHMERHSNSDRKSLVQKDCVLYLSRVQTKLDEISTSLQINMMNVPRPGKKLLVLDLDYTLMDSKAYSDYSVHALDMARPYLHEFLSALWPFYDICIWSATNWRWLESKLIELGMVGGQYADKYLIEFVLDRGTMFELTSMRHGKVSRHEVKALELIWRKIPAYNATNTLHLDDLSRNFVLNPSSGVKISAFKNARANKHDRQLVFLARYFLQLASVPDVREMDHRKWVDCDLPLPSGVKDPLEILDSLDPELIKLKTRQLNHHQSSSKSHHHHSHC